MLQRPLAMPEVASAKGVVAELSEAPGSSAITGRRVRVCRVRRDKWSGGD